MRKMNLVWKFAVICFTAFIIAGCSKEQEPETDPEAEMTEEERILLKANKFIYDYTTEAYLWESKIPSNVKYTSASNPKDLFELMRYKELDKWSSVTDNSQEAMEEFQGVSTTFGYSLAFGVFSNAQDKYFAIVKFVYPGSPAEKAGLKRGDFLMRIAGADINQSNYLQLYYGSTITVELGVRTPEGAVGLSGKSVTMTAVKMYEDPVVDYKVIESAEKKIGYLCYTGFYAESHQKLEEVFAGFKNQGVTELILDLRYNPGGNADTPPYLGSLIAPQSVVKKKSIFLTQVWNDLYMAYFNSKNEDMNIYFHSDIPVNLNLNKVYVLTTGSTASASEATISGLSPYMDVVKIGETSYGKYCGAALLSPTNSNGQVDQEIKNWLLTLVVYKFVNIKGFTEFKDGIMPDYEVSDAGLLEGIPLGDTSDPMIAKAIELITGSKTKSPAISLPVDVELLPKMGERQMKGGMNVVMNFNVK